MRQQLDTSSDDLKELLKETNKIAKESLEIAKKTRHSLRMMHFTNTVKLLLILIPLVAAIIFLPALLDKLNTQFKAITGGAGLFDNFKKQ